ncbi:MAG: MaoC family dehydratase N-terminal domain-containing protein [Acidimicrobiaceae bacterium]|nr:MaoC family dehydratase N-terminal domain-containing protein [Acidimicrobiaceae bacterium]MDE0495186.1 MaoC family dehydratase N-terminal domain-containing protein [Acidimicrobiaceae bacterium]MDE0666513.1 MaoC family dehydratase N-terminal domain-containing protein [Acidimicrobiaceae bacterium]
MTGELPADVAELIGRPVYPETADFPAEMGYGWNTLAATENGNPLYWEPAVAEMLSGGTVLPLSTLSLWMRPHRWAPGAVSEQVALQVHFDLKDRLELPEAIMSDNTIAFHEPVRPGDVISHHQVLRSVSGPKTTRLGSGRFWVIDVEYHNQDGTLVGVESYTGFGYRRTGAAPAGQPQESGRAESPSPSEASGPRAKPDPAHDQVRVGDALPELTHDVTATTVVLGAVASRDWRPMHHDYRFATERNGTQDIFLNTPNQLAWIERAITDWTGPKGRPGRISFRMHDPVFPGDRMTIAARVAATPIDETGCGWAELDLVVRGGDRTCTTGTARVALPMTSVDNPWLRRGEDWRP